MIRDKEMITDWLYRPFDSGDLLNIVKCSIPFVFKKSMSKSYLNVNLIHVISDLSNGDIYNHLVSDPNPRNGSQYFSKANISKTVHFRVSIRCYKVSHRMVAVLMTLCDL